MRILHMFIDRALMGGKFAANDSVPRLWREHGYLPNTRQPVACSVES